MGFKTDRMDITKSYKTLENFVIALSDCCDTNSQRTNVMALCPEADTGHGGVFAWLNYGNGAFMSKIKDWHGRHSFDELFIHINWCAPVGDYLINHCADLNEEKDFPTSYFTISLQHVVDNYERLIKELN